MLNACEKGTYTNSVDPDETPRKRGVSSGSALFAKISTRLVMVNYKKKMYMIRPSGGRYQHHRKFCRRLRLVLRTRFVHITSRQESIRILDIIFIYFWSKMCMQMRFFRMRSYAPLTQALENSTRPLVFTSACLRLRGK